MTTTYGQQAVYVNITNGTHAFGFCDYSSRNLASSTEIIRDLDLKVFEVIVILSIVQGNWHQHKYLTIRVDKLCYILSWKCLEIIK